jgi:hypothetical protein
VAQVIGTSALSLGGNAVPIGGGAVPIGGGANNSLAPEVLTRFVQPRMGKRYRLERTRFGSAAQSPFITFNAPRLAETHSRKLIIRRGEIKLSIEMFFVRGVFLAPSHGEKVPAPSRLHEPSPKQHSPAVGVYLL